MIAGFIIGFIVGAIAVLATAALDASDAAEGDE